MFTQFWERLYVLLLFSFVSGRLSIHIWSVIVITMFVSHLQRSASLSNRLFYPSPFMTIPVDFILSFRLTVKIYPSTFLHVHKCTCSSVYLFSLFLLFRHNMHNDLSTHLLGYLYTDPPENTFSLFTIMVLFRLTIKTYLSPQLLVYLPIDVPVHDPTCSFSLSIW